MRYTEGEGAIAGGASSEPIDSCTAALEAAYEATVPQTSLGTEFMSGRLQGALASTSASAPITDLWAVTSYVAR